MWVWLALARSLPNPHQPPLTKNNGLDCIFLLTRRAFGGMIEVDQKTKRAQG